MDPNRRFWGSIGEHYRLTLLVAPYHDELQQTMASAIASYLQGAPAVCIEIGVGEGFTTRRLAAANPLMYIIGLDHEPAMIAMATTESADLLAQSRLELHLADALDFLRTVSTGTIDVIASAMTIHNFWSDYRGAFLRESYRVLKPGGLFLNTDRYALTAPVHQEHVRQQITRFNEVLLRENRTDLIEPWIAHLLEDDHPLRIMREKEATESMTEIGFDGIHVRIRHETDALLLAQKKGGLR